MEASSKNITWCLSSAKVCVDKALIRINEKDEQSAQKYIKKAIHFLKAADSLIIQNHMTICIPKMIKTNPSNNVVVEIMKTYKYVSS